MDGEFGIRAGEIAITLPEGFDAGVYFIGQMERHGRGARVPQKWARDRCGVHHSARIRYVAGLAGVESCSHLLVLYWMDKARRDLVRQVPRHYGEQRGTFAALRRRGPIRSPRASCA